MTHANPARGEASIRVGGAALVLRPSFAALVAAEAELGPLFALVERAASGDRGNWRGIGDGAGLPDRRIRPAPPCHDRRHGLAPSKRK